MKPRPTPQPVTPKKEEPQFSAATGGLILLCVAMVLDFLIPFSGWFIYPMYFISLILGAVGTGQGHAGSGVMVILFSLLAPVIVWILTIVVGVGAYM